MPSGKSLMTALFPDRESAELGFLALAERGYTRDEIDVLMSEYAMKRYFRPCANDTALGAKAQAIAPAGAGLLDRGDLPAERARQYRQGICSGGIVMMVTPRCPEDAWYLDNVWRISRAQYVYC